MYKHKQDYIESLKNNELSYKPTIAGGKKHKTASFYEKFESFSKTVAGIARLLMVEAVQWKRMEELNFSWSNDPSSLASLLAPQLS